VNGQEAAKPKRRRRVAEQAQAAPAAVRTVRESSSPVRATAPAVSGGQRTVTWILVGAAALVVVLAAITGTVLLRALGSKGGNDIPVVADITGRQQGTSVVFTWPDPGLQADDTYQVATRNGDTATQPSNRFSVSGTPGQPACITVTVNRDGKLGAPSAEKCVDVGAGT
jgi:hypothetical protein